MPFAVVNPCGGLFVLGDDAGDHVGGERGRHQRFDNHFVCLEKNA